MYKLTDVSEKHIASIFRAGRGAYALKKKPEHSLNALLNVYQSTTGIPQMSVFVVLYAMRTKVYLTKRAAYVSLISKGQSMLEFGCSRVTLRLLSSVRVNRGQARMQQ